MKIVKFKDGRYGIRKWTLFGYRFLGLESYYVTWWNKESSYMQHCKSFDLEEVKNKLDVGEPI